MAEQVIRYPDLVPPNAFTQEELGWVPWLEPKPVEELTDDDYTALVERSRAGSPYFRLLVRDPVAIESVGIERLTEDELSILDFVDGKQKIRDIIPLTNMSSFDACKILFQLMEARLVRRKPR